MSTSRSASRAALRLLDCNATLGTSSECRASSFASSSKLRLHSTSASRGKSAASTTTRGRNFSTCSSCRSAWPAGHDAEADSYTPQASSYSAASQQATSSGSSSSSPGISVKEALRRIAATRVDRKATAAVKADEEPKQSLGMSERREGKAPARAAGGEKTIRELHRCKSEGIPITVLTAYDFPTALSLRAADVDVCLVGDSLANVALGYDSTQRLTLGAMKHHVAAVVRGLSSPLLAAAPQITPKPLLIADLPFGSYYASDDEGVRAAVELLQEAGADGVKIEGGVEVVSLIKRLTSFGIPVMGHVGLQPQRATASSGFRLQGRTCAEALQVYADARAVQAAGAFAVVLECVPNRVGEEVSRLLDIPTVGIGAGPRTDGQVLVANDMLGDLTGPGHVLAGLAASTAAGGETRTLTLNDDAPQPPKFVRSFAVAASGGTSLGALRVAAVQAYVEAVRSRTFPDPDVEGYKMKKEEFEAFRKELASLA